MPLSPRLLARCLAGWTLALLALAAALSVVALGPGSLWGGVAHESEPRSLLATALFPGHALRELPHVLLLSFAFLAGAAPPRDRRDAAAKVRALLLFFLLATAILGAAAALQEGPRAALADLLQARGAPDLVGAGVHVRLHLVSDLALAALFAAAGRLIAARPEPPPQFVALPLALAGAMLLAMALTAGFEGVASPRFVGHAARELQAHSMMTLPALLAVALAVPGARLDFPAGVRSLLFRACAAIAFAASGWLAWHALGASLLSASSAPARPWWLNLAVHQYEHLIDVALLLIAFAVWRRSGAGAREAS